ncbi:MAG: DUF401 family protein [Oscillibacter sp.]|jgi:integral membrane protein (TIGR00529 family)|nr:DUF401 family protein [Oscillibacter sp.]MCI9002692.1 DUF401 family protein [Oscillibacter sp.]
MDLLKLVAVFCIIILVMWMKKPLLTAVLAATIGTVVLYQLPLTVTCAAVGKGATSWTTIETLLVFYTTTFLQRMLEKRKNLSDCQVALNGLFNNRRINASVVPLLLGCLPSASTVLICGPIVRDSVEDYLSAPEKAAITSYFRHITESFLPTYTTIFIAVGLTNGAVSVSAFVLAMLPMVAALFLTGHLVYLRKVPKDTGMVSQEPKAYYWKLLVRSIWSIALAIGMILVFKLPVELAVFLCILLNIFVNHFRPGELLPFFRSAFETKLLASTWLIMIFKEVLAATGVIEKLPAFFSALPLPTFFIFALIFFFGTLVAGNQACIVLCMPMVMAALNGAISLSLFVLLMCMNYVAMQISPIHICLTLCAEDNKVSFSSMAAKTLPMVLIFIAVSFLYYGGLRFLGL